MKNILAVLLLLQFTTLLSQVEDSLISDNMAIRVMQNKETKIFRIIHKPKNDSLVNLKFAKQIANYFQVLDANDRLFYVSYDWEVASTVKDYFGVCGTVPEYVLTIKTGKQYFTIFEDKVAYNKENIIPMAKLKISKPKASKVMFINGENKFIYDGNFKSVIQNIDPSTLILFKNGKYFTQESPSLKFDSIDFTDYNKILKTRTKDLYGILEVFAPKYKQINKFEYYLAKALTKTGQAIFIDIYGNEY